jgi:YggT family protein
MAAGFGRRALFRATRPRPAAAAAGARGGSGGMFLDVVFFLLRAVLDLLWWAVLLAVLVQLLISFNVLDTRNRFIWTVADFLYRLTEPLFRRLRRVLPQLGPVDLAPLAVLLLITAAEMLLNAIRNSLISSGMYF